MRRLVLLIACLVAAPARAGLPDVQRCLRANDIPCAEREISALSPDSSTNVDVVVASARVHFHAGRYDRAFDALARAKTLGWTDPDNDVALYERTMYTTAGWVEEVRGPYRIRFEPGADAILVEDAVEALRRTDERLVPLIGARIPGDVVVEIYPNGSSFIAASSLTREDVETTSIVGLSKWSRLLVTSPRALGRGYSWQDTLSHEYLHLVISHATHDRAPVWLQEAIAKYLDPGWNADIHSFEPSVHQQSLLAKALAEDDLVTFDEMHPSLAKLPSADRASLAYGQLAMLMKFAFERGGDDLLKRALPAVRDGVDPRLALANAAGFPNFDAMNAAWEPWLRAQPLVRRELEALPTVLDAGSEADLDPVLDNHQDLARWVRLGDLLMEHERPKAALVEYAKAVVPEEVESPLTANRIAAAHLALGDTLSARLALLRSLENYPDFPLTHKTLGQVYQREQKPAEAVSSYRKALALNPFDVEIRSSLVTLYRQLNDAPNAAKQDAALAVIRRGGDDLARTPLHTRHGEVELPSREGTNDQISMIGRDAPELDVVDLAGQRVRLADWAGQVVVIDFWATWCGPCRASMPHLSELYTRNQAAGLRVIGVTDEENRVIQPFLRRTPLPYTLARDPDRNTKQAYNVASLPTMFVIGRDGKVLDVLTGWSEANAARLDAAVAEALSAPVTPPGAPPLR
jgi:peroxiredoxin